MKRIALVLLLTLVAGCDPTAKWFSAGPYSGQVIDAKTGQPVPGAFVGFRWYAFNWVAGSIPCLLAVLVQADEQGRYQVPWQGDRLKTWGVHGVDWNQQVWAPGYVLLNTGAMTGAETKNAVVALQAVASTMEALDMKHRLNPVFYTCGTENKFLNSDVQRALGLALYRDSYHRVCEEQLPDEALTRWYLETPHADHGTYRGYDSNAQAAYDPEREMGEAWEAFYYKAGWMKPGSGWAKDFHPLDRALLPELCHLMHFASQLSVALP